MRGGAFLSIVLMCLFAPFLKAEENVIKKLADGYRSAAKGTRCSLLLLKQHRVQIDKLQTLFFESSDRFFQELLGDAEKLPTQPGGYAVRSDEYDLIKPFLGKFIALQYGAMRRFYSALHEYIIRVYASMPKSIVRHEITQVKALADRIQFKGDYRVDKLFAAFPHQRDTTLNRRFSKRWELLQQNAHEPRAFKLKSDETEGELIPSAIEAYRGFLLTRERLVKLLDVLPQFLAGSSRVLEDDILDESINPVLSTPDKFTPVGSYSIEPTPVETAPDAPTYDSPAPIEEDSLESFILYLGEAHPNGHTAHQFSAEAHP